MVSILESYTLKCNACGKPKKVSRLRVNGNLAQIEATWVCPPCQQAAPTENAPGAPAEGASA